jgi:hypothetical protein
MEENSADRMIDGRTIFVFIILPSIILSLRRCPVPPCSRDRARFTR